MTDDDRRDGRMAAGRGLAVAAAAISGIAVFTNSVALERFDDPTDYTTAKNAVAGIVLVTLAAVTSGPRAAWRETAQAPRTALFALAFAGSVPFVLFFEGLARTDSTDAAFLHKTLVAWVALGAVAFLGERVRVHHVAAIVAILVGQHQLVGGFGLGDPGSGEALITAATLIWAVEVIVAKRLLADVTPAVVSATRMGAGGAALVAWALVRGSLDEVVSPGWDRVGWLLLTGFVLAGFVTVWHRALAAAPAIEVTAILTGGAIVTALADQASGRGSIGSAWVGLSLVAVGLAAVLRPWTRATRPARPCGARPATGAR